MRFSMDFSKLPKCGAQPKKNSSRTWPCRHIALANGRCYYHQGRPQKHGHYTQKACVAKTTQRAVINEMRQSLRSLDNIINKK